MRSLLPPAVHVEESVDVDREIELRPEEAPHVAQAVDARRREFAAGRSMAHAALRAIESDVDHIGVGEHREPLWPTGVVGSITHCVGYAAAAVAASRDVRSLGIDAEPAAELPADVVDLVASDEERERLDGASPIALRVLFSAKESVYKAWFPLTGRWLGFEDCDLTLTPFDASNGSFVGNLRPDSFGEHLDLRAFHGRYVVDAQRVLTAVVVPRERTGR